MPTPPKGFTAGDWRRRLRIQRLFHVGAALVLFMFVDSLAFYVLYGKVLTPVAAESAFFVDSKDSLVSAHSSVAKRQSGITAAEKIFSGQEKIWALGGGLVLRKSLLGKVVIYNAGILFLMTVIVLTAAYREYRKLSRWRLAGSEEDASEEQYS